LSGLTVGPTQHSTQGVPSHSWGQSSWGVALTTHLHLAPGLKKE